jgi:hypothetical protein
MRKIKKLVIFLILFIILISSVYGACTITEPDNQYFEDEIVSFQMSCDGATEKSKSYNVSYYYPDGTYISSDIGTTPSTISQPFFETFLVPLNDPDIIGNYSANLTVNAVYKDGERFEVINTSINILNFFDEDYSTSIVLGKTAKLAFKIQYNGNLVANAHCHANIISPRGHPLYSCVDDLHSHGDGQVFVNIDTEELNKQTVNDMVGNAFVWDIGCMCFKNCSNPTDVGCCIDATTGEYFENFAHGEIELPFTVTADESDYSTDGVDLLTNVVLVLFLSLLFGAVGFGINSFDKDKIFTGLRNMFAFMAIFELLMSLAFVYANELNYNIELLTQINLVSLVLISVIIIFVFLMKYMFNVFNFGKKESRW